MSPNFPFFVEDGLLSGITIIAWDFESIRWSRIVWEGNIAEIIYLQLNKKIIFVEITLTIDSAIF